MTEHYRSKCVTCEVVASPDIELWVHSACEFAFENNFTLRQSGNQVGFCFPNFSSTRPLAPIGSVFLPDYFIVSNEGASSNVQSIVEVGAKKLLDLTDNQVHRVISGEKTYGLDPNIISNYRLIRNKLINLAILLGIANRGKFTGLAEVQELVFATQHSASFPLSYLQREWKKVSNHFKLTDDQRNIKLVHIFEPSIDLGTISNVAGAFLAQITSDINLK